MNTTTAEPPVNDLAGPADMLEALLPALVLVGENFPGLVRQQDFNEIHVKMRQSIERLRALDQADHHRQVQILGPLVGECFATVGHAQWVRDVAPFDDHGVNTSEAVAHAILLALRRAGHEPEKLYSTWVTKQARLPSARRADV